MGQSLAMRSLQKIQERSRKKDSIAGTCFGVKRSRLSAFALVLITELRRCPQTGGKFAHCPGIAAN
jgi:hypothetical protein